MRRLTLCLLLAAAVLVVPTGARAEETTGRILVTVDKSASTRAQSAMLRSAGATAQDRIPEIGLVAVEPKAGQSVADTLKALKDTPGIKTAGVERRAKLRALPNDPALTTPETTPGTPAGTPVQWWAARQGLTGAWELTRGASAKVAIIDTGADTNHPDLAGKVDGVFDVDGDPGHAATGDENGHGTHVASLACGAGNNGFGIAGAGLDCRLFIYKSDLSDFSVASAVIDAARRGVDAINMSFGTDGTVAAPPGLVDAFNFAVQRNVVLVAAAADAPTQENGDPSNVLQPTNTGASLTDPSIRGLSITAAQFNGQRASFAGLGTQVSMAAYGYFGPAAQGGPPGILAAFPGNSTELESGGTLLQPAQPCYCRVRFSNDPRFAYLAGTSMSSPMVAGAAALMRDINPDLTALEIVRILKEQATRPAGTGWTPELGWGILNAGKAVLVAAVTDRHAPSSKLKGPKKVSRGGKITLRWSGKDAGSGKGKASGIARYEVYRKANKAKKYTRVLRTAKTKRRVTVRSGSTYRYYVRAVDKSGNREAAPKKPDLTVKVGRKR